jgi:uncharacterized protein
MTEDLERLLVVQDLDTTITQLQHRRDALAETTGLAAAETQLAALEVERADAAARRGVLAASQKELEEQIGGITERRDVVEKRMYAATGSSGRDLQAMNDEVRHLTERRAELEELELVSMLEQDPIDAELAALRAQTDPLEAQAEEFRGEVAAGEVEIDAALAEAHEARSAEAALLPAALSERYERLRARLKGTGAARLIRSHCDGCHLELSSGEVEKIRALPSGEVATCEQCGRILVPT